MLPEGQLALVTQTLKNVQYSDMVVPKILIIKITHTHRCYQVNMKLTFTWSLLGNNKCIYLLLLGHAFGET